MKTELEILHEPFDIDVHAKTFIHYCEVVIHPSGLVEYAIPSHQEKLIQVYMEKHNLTREQCEEQWNKDSYWLDKAKEDTGLVLVWDMMIDASKIKLTTAQKVVLKLLHEKGCIEVDPAETIRANEREPF